MKADKRARDPACMITKTDLFAILYKPFEVLKFTLHRFVNASL